MKNHLHPVPPTDSDSYTQTAEFITNIGGDAIRYFSKPGLPAWKTISPAAALLAKTVSPKQDDRLVWIGCGHGASVVPVARRMPRGELWLTDLNWIGLQMTRLTLAANGISNGRLFPKGEGGWDHPFEELEAGTFDLAVIELPKGRKLARRWLSEAYTALRPGGELYLAGANEGGIRPVAEDGAALFGSAAILAYKKGNRVVRLRKEINPPSQPEWMAEAGIRSGSWVEFEAQILEEELRLFSLPGVFSYDRLDPGTLLLLSHLKAHPGERVLDAGCGYGVIGLAAARLGAGQVDLVDVNLMAVAAARRNLTAHAPGQVQLQAGDILGPFLDQRYHLILSNPPFHSGGEVDYGVTDALITQGHAVLEPGGRLILVANRFIRYDRLMKKWFGQVEILAENNQFHLLAAAK